MVEEKNVSTAVALPKDNFIDLTGSVTGVKLLSKKLLISFGVAIAVYFLVSLADMTAYGEMASKGLGMFLATLIIMIGSGLPVWITSMTSILISIAIGFYPWQTAGSYIGSSPFYTMLGMMLVAMGAELTPIGKRMAFLALKIFGQKPILLVLAMGLVSATISAFVSNTATMIMMSAIGLALLQGMGEKPGESVIGRVMVLVIVVGAFYGGSALISGSSYGNYMAVAMLEQGTEGAFSITYTEWAKFGIPCFFIIIPVIFVYIKTLGLKNSGYALPPKSYYEEKLKEIGPVGGSEIRWVILVFGMVFFLLQGNNASHMAMLFGVLAVFPGVGVMPFNKAINKIPFAILLSMGITPVMSNLLTGTGVITWVGDIVRPILGNTSPLMFMILCAALSGFLVNILVNSSIHITLMLIFSSVAVSIGLNPTVLLWPAMIMNSFFWCMGVNQYMLMSKSYGYWEDKHAMIPGYISIALISVLASLIVYALAPLYGMSYYI